MWWWAPSEVISSQRMSHHKNSEAGRERLETLMRQLSLGSVIQGLFVMMIHCMLHAAFLLLNWPKVDNPYSVTFLNHTPTFEWPWSRRWYMLQRDWTMCSKHDTCSKLESRYTYTLNSVTSRTFVTIKVHVILRRSVVLTRMCDERASVYVACGIMESHKVTVACDDDNVMCVSVWVEFFGGFYFLCQNPWYLGGKRVNEEWDLNWEHDSASSMRSRDIRERMALRRLMLRSLECVWETCVTM